MKKEIYLNWVAGIVDIFIIAMAVVVSVWQDNTKFLWLLALTLLTGKYFKDD